VLAVEASMRAYARRFGADEDFWGITGLLHDLDYERFPSLDDGHPRMAMAELQRQGYPDEMIRAIGSHADETGLSRDSELERALYAVDELSGFVLACAYVRPEGLQGMTPKSVKKKMKTASFAAAVDRDQLRDSAADLGVDFDEHVAFVIAALAEQADTLLARDERSPVAPPHAADDPRDPGPAA
jgi:predicted hydrolase (HD superfamily)